MAQWFDRSGLQLPLPACGFKSRLGQVSGEMYHLSLLSTLNVNKNKSMAIDPLTVGAEYIRVCIFY